MKKMSIDASNEAKMSHKMGQENSIGTILGIDFGASKIGLAIADEETRIAFAFDILKNDNEFLPQLKEIVLRENVKKIIIGTTAHEKDVKSADEKMKFAQTLKKEINTPIEFQEEMFSTKMAHANIKERGSKHIAQFDDAEAARIILQSWLDSSI